MNFYQKARTFFKVLQNTQLFHIKGFKIIQTKAIPMIRDSATIQKQNIWQEAGKEKQKDIRATQVEKTIIVVGEPSSGKSSFIKVYKSDLDFQTKPTNLLQYSYIKKMATKKELIHCYEIATKSLSEIMGSLIPKDSFSEAVFVICVDLSKPESAIEKTLQWINLVRKEMDTFVNEKLLTRQDKYQEFMEGIKENYAENEDKDTIHPMPLHSIMIGCKYDLFERYDTESRKWLSRALRYIAHHNNMSLYFSSTKNMQVGAQLRSYMQENMFKDKKSRPASQFEHIKPIFINNGEDSIHSMNLPTSSSLNTIEILKKQLGSLFGYDQKQKKQPIDLEKFGETKIDNIINQKKKQLDRITKLVSNVEGRKKY